MTDRVSLLIATAAMGGEIVLAGCQTRPTPTLFPTAASQVVVQVVTATPQPLLEETLSSEPTITPLATFTPISTLGATRTPTATRKPVAAGPTIDKRTTLTTPSLAPSPTEVQAQNLYPGAGNLGPSNGTVIHDGDALVLQFDSVGPLPSNVCYRIYVEMVNPNTGGFSGDWWLTPTGDQSPPGARIRFELTKFTGQYSYQTIRDKARGLVDSTLIVKWNVTVVQDNGGPDPVHHNFVPLGPSSPGPDLFFQL